MSHLSLLQATLAGLLLLVCCAMTADADFPQASKLPIRPELPDPLVMLDGTKVTSKDDWLNKRRPELKQLFQHYMYGHMPPKPANVKFQVERIDKEALGGKATLKEVTISFGPPGTPKLRLLLIVPNKRKGPAPVFVGLNFRGNHTVLNDAKIALPTTWIPNGPGVKDNKATDAGRGIQADVWNIEEVIARGYAVATIYCGDIDPDRADKREGIQPHVDRDGKHDWGTVAAWAWGIMRAIDYLETDADIDATRIIVVGHSRLGKTALVAAAFDERIALAIPHQAGCGGTGPSRAAVGNKGAESVKRINTSFPHWFNQRFKEFNEEPERLPFDQHCLVALVAPRPVLFTNAVDDKWANPDGQFEMLKGADPVYRLLGVEGLGAKAIPETNAVLDSRLGYWMRPGKHSMNRDDWQVWLNFADKHLKTK